MNRTELERHRREISPVTVRRGTHAGTRMLVIGMGYSYAPGDHRHFVPSSHRPGDHPRVGLARYRPMPGDWVPHLALLSELTDYRAWQEVSSWGAAEAAIERSILEDARHALRSSLKDANLGGAVQVRPDGRLALVMSPGAVWDLARSIR